MTEFTRFLIYGPGSRLTPRVGDLEDFERLVTLACMLGISVANKSTPRAIKVYCEKGHPGLEKIFSALEELGWLPVYGTVSPQNENTHFNVRSIVEYSGEDIESADLLRLGDIWGDWCLAHFAGRVERRWIGKVDSVGMHSGKKWRQSYGTVENYRNYFVNDKVRRQFEDAKLRLGFHPLMWDAPKRARHNYWEIDTTTIMPECLLSIEVDSDGNRRYSDGGRDFPELKFARAHVAALGAFDAAWCREEVGVPNNPTDGGHMLVVSQQFRKTCERLKLLDVRFVPVRLV